MTARNLYEGVLIELNKENAPNILLEDFNYFVNKAINLYINKRYNIYDINLQTTDDLRVLKATAILPVNKIDDYKGLTLAGGGDKLATYEVIMPSDYLHILNCICIYNVKKTYKCYNAGDTWRSPATRLTADAYSQVLDNFWNKPTYKRPYYYIHNVNQPIDSQYIPTNPWSFTEGSSETPVEDPQENVGSRGGLLRGKTQTKPYLLGIDDWEYKVENGKATITMLHEAEVLSTGRTVTKYTLEDWNCWEKQEKQIPEIDINGWKDTSFSDVTSDEICHDPKDIEVLADAVNFVSYTKTMSSPGTDSATHITNPTGAVDGSVSKYGKDAHNIDIVLGSGLPHFIKDKKGLSISNVERGASIRYGNVSQVRLEIRYGTDNSIFELQNVYIDYIKAPQNIRLTQEEVDYTEDRSQMLEFPDYVCQEIINELVHLIMENITDQRLQTHPVVSLSIANPAQALAPEAAGQTA